MNNEFSDALSVAKKTVSQNLEWKERYKTYANEINSNLFIIRKQKDLFNEWAPLYLYMNVSRAKRSPVFNLRYQGQEVADITVRNKEVKINTRDFDKNNEKYYGCGIRLREDGWRSPKAAEFRKFFRSNPSRSSNVPHRNLEHEVESALLTEFAGRRGSIKLIRGIQPVRLGGIARFQMPTPLAASKAGQVSYRKKGGGIDILARVGKGRATRLCVMEVKDENCANEPPSAVIKQGLSYAAFIIALLKSRCGQKWWSIFGFGGKVPSPVNLCVACVMPGGSNPDTSFGKQIILSDKDSCELHYVYYERVAGKFTKMDSSLAKGEHKTALSFLLGGGNKASITTPSIFCYMLKTMAGIKRLVFLIGSAEETRKGMALAKQILRKHGLEIIELDFINPSAQVSLGMQEVEMTADGPFSIWKPPTWWPQKPAAICCNGITSKTDPDVIRALCKFSVLDGSEDRKNLPQQKFKDGSFLLLEDNENGQTMKTFMNITAYARDEILRLEPPFVETETTTP